MLLMVSPMTLPGFANILRLGGCVIRLFSVVSFMVSPMTLQRFPSILHLRGCAIGLERCVIYYEKSQWKCNIGHPGLCY